MKIDLFKYDINDIVSFFESLDLIKPININKEIENKINKICTLEDILMVSFYMSGRNSPMPYNKRGRIMSIGYMNNLYFRETGKEISEERKNEIVHKYGVDAYEGLGRMVRNIVDLMEPLIVKVEIQEDSIKIINSYIRVYDKNIILNRAYILTKNKDKELVMRSKYKDILIRGFKSF